jgi:hypothetical protein
MPPSNQLGQREFLPTGSRRVARPMGDTGYPTDLQTAEAFAASVLRLFKK